MVQNPSPLAPQILAELQTQNLVNYHNAVPSALLRSYLSSEYSANSIAGLTELTTLELGNRSLTSLKGIEYATGLTTLTANNNDISSVLDLSALNSLTYLYLLNNQLTDIGDISRCTLLTYLNLEGNQLTGIGNVSDMTLITNLKLSNNSLADIGDMSNMTSLRYIWLDNNEFEQAELEGIIDDIWVNRAAIAANGGNIQLQSNPGSSAAETSKASEISDLIAAGCSVTI